MKTQNFTTTLSSSTISSLDEMAKREGRTKREILEEALSELQKGRIKSAIRKSYKTASGDKEMQTLANGDITEWEDSIRQWEAK